MKFSENLKRIRKKNKISQEELAEKLGVSRQSVSKWETGENYPSMHNIMILCDLLNCKMDELVCEEEKNMNQLDKEIKQNIVKFKKEKQKKMKGISKTIYILARIGKIISILGMISLSLTIAITPIFLSHIQITDNNIKILGEEIKYKEVKNGIQIMYRKENTFIHQNEYKHQINFINHFKENPYKVIGFIETAFLFLLITLILLQFAFSILEKLFINIHDKDTPFSLENVNYIKKLAIFMTLIIIIPNIAGSILSIITEYSIGIDFELIELIYILIFFSMAYIFEYGYFIQLDSKGKIYGEIEE